MKYQQENIRPSLHPSQSKVVLSNPYMLQGNQENLPPRRTPDPLDSYMSPSFAQPLEDETNHCQPPYKMKLDDLKCALQKIKTNMNQLHTRSDQIGSE